MGALISSRTPEGRQFECPHCGLFDRVEPSILTGDACCPACGHLIWFAVEGDGPEPPEPRRGSKLKESRRRGRKAARAGGASREFRDFEDWLHREMADQFSPAQMFGILRRATEILEVSSWGPVRRAWFFERLREALREAADRPLRLRPPNAPLQALFRLIGGLTRHRDRDEARVRHAMAPAQDPLFDPWLDGI
jgi:hypothetical protein